MAGSNDEPGGVGTEESTLGWLRDWVLLTANRWTVTGAVVVAMFAAFVVFGALDPVGLRTAVRESDPLETLFQAFVTAIITGVTLVVTINQLVLSQELNPVGDQRERMDESVSFRRDVGDALDLPASPAEPSSFLRALVGHARELLGRLETAVDGTDPDLEAAVDDHLGEVEPSARDVERRLRDAEFGTFDVVLATLQFNYSLRLYWAHRLRNEYDDVLPPAAAEALEDLSGTLRMFGVAREHVKTLYFQWELINVSRAMLYAAVPALVVAASFVLYVDDPGTVTGATLGVDNLVWAASAAATLASLPFVILLSYVLRIATVAKRTLATGPFVLGEVETGEGEN
jgi:hypothetical protein